MRGGLADRPDRNRSISLHDAAARWRAAPAGDEAGHAATNIVPLRRGPRDEAHAAPPLTINANARPAPGTWQSERLSRWALLLAISAAAHASLYLPFQQEPAPMASIGETAISVEIVLGANQHAGLTPDQGTSEASAPTPAQAPEVTIAEVEPTETAQLEAPVERPAAAPEAPAEQPREVAAAPVEQPRPAEPTEVPPAPATPDTPETKAEAAPVIVAAPAETPPAIRPVTPVEAVEDATPAPAPVQARPQVEVATAAELQVSPSPPPAEATAASPVKEAVAETAKPVEVATVVLPTESATPPPRPAQRQTRPAPTRAERTRETARTRRPPRAVAQGERNRSTTTSPAAAAAGGVGRGRSDADSNYRGRVAAHLARHKRFPHEARNSGNQGSATIAFALDGGGRVTSVRLVRGSGVASLDQEATAMVRRASPFPAPPGGHGMNFTVPVSFRLN